jgi:hypothetical protein
LRQVERTTTTRSYDPKTGLIEREVIRAVHVETGTAYTYAYSFSGGWSSPLAKPKRTVVTTTRTYDHKGRLVTETVNDGPEPTAGSFKFDLGDWYNASRF